jgi:2-keto-4-pentenoate hydratase/2-oxohepta-3-ene-1,7-dioic acid hydratase in catechol pathway
MGPWIVTRDEIADPQDVRVRLWVDDELRQDYSTQDMDHPVSELVAWASRVATLDPGDLISCGTNHQGLGPLQDGDRVAMEIEAVGRLEFTVEDPFGRSWPKGIDTAIAERVRTLRTADR